MQSELAEGILAEGILPLILGVDAAIAAAEYDNL
jgi:hypothetical protein